jgi:hypothetical protein
MIRGWFPQEPVSKASTKIQLGPINRSQSFKVRRWLHGTSAFISSLMGQLSLKTKILVITLAVGIFLPCLLYNLTINHFINGFVLHWAAMIVPNAFLILTIAFYSYDYFKKRKYRKSHLSENRSPILRLWGTIIGVTGGAIIAISYLLTLFEFSFPKLSTIPFYLGLLGLLVSLPGWGLYMEWRKRNKLSPFNSI